FYLLASRLRLGALADFLSRPILVGFMAGVSLGIIVGQLGKVTGVSLASDQIGPRLVEVAGKLSLVSRPTLGIALGVCAVFDLSPRFVPRVPAALLAMILAGAAVAFLDLDHEGVVVLGPVPGGLPSLHLPVFPLDKLGALFGAAGAVALVGFTSSIVT